MGLAAGNAYKNRRKDLLERLGFDPTINPGGGLGIPVLNQRAKYPRLLIRER